MKRLQAIGRRLRRDAGAALITVLLLVSLMSVAAVTAFETLGFAIKRTAAAGMYDQARLYALGAEQIARVAAEQWTSTDQQVLNAIGFDGEGTISYPIEGGRIEGRLTDISNCFNVNSIVEANDAGMLVANETNLARFQYLMELLGLSDGQAQALAATLVDWMDGDTRPSSRGAEDYDYAGAVPPYRAANSPFADISELTLVDGFDAEVRALVAPFLCALPSSELAKLNVNALTAEQAVLMTALLGRSFTYEQMRGVVTERPAIGYGEIGDFWTEPVFSGRPIPDDVRASADVRPVRFRADLRVRYFDADIRMVSRLFVGDDGISRVLDRNFGAIL